tara:strand:+ start:1746 stop:1991 length:246 start_codon:yes stop_codon:yes gene_type:complete
MPKVKVNRGFLRMSMFLNDGDIKQTKRCILLVSLGLIDSPIIPKKFADEYRLYKWEQLWTKDEEEWLIKINKDKDFNHNVE